MEGADLADDLTKLIDQFREQINKLDRLEEAVKRLEAAEVAKAGKDANTERTPIS